MKLRPIRVLTVIGAALVLMAGGAVAYAQIPAADGTISACYTKSTGTIRIIDTGVACKKGETSLTWNQHGNPGTNGTNGKDGSGVLSGNGTPADGLGKDGDFYDGKRQAARYFFRFELPKTAPQLDLLESLDRTTLEMRDGWF